MLNCNYKLREERKLNYTIGKPVQAVVVRPSRSYSIGSVSPVEQRNDVVIPDRVSRVDYSSGKPKRVVVAV